MATNDVWVVETFDLSSMFNFHNPDDVKSSTAFLQDKTMWLKKPQNRKELPEEMMTVAIEVQEQIPMCEDNFSNKAVMDLLKEAYRVIRNGCAYCKVNQDRCYRNLAVKRICLSLGRCLSHSVENLVLTCAVQALSNCVANHYDNQQQLIGHLPVLKRVMQTGAHKVVEYTCMVLHTCLLCQEWLHFFMSNDCLYAVLPYVLQQCKGNTTIFSHFLIETLLKADHFLKIVHPKISQDDWCLLLEYLAALSESGDINASNLFYLAQLFDCASKKAQKMDKAEDLKKFMDEILLRRLVIAIADWSHTQTVKDIPTILPATIGLFKHIIRIGSTGEKNRFTPIRREEAEVDEYAVQYNFRTRLLQIMANMAHSHTANQTQTREMGGLNIVLNHTTIDAQNPFQGQWAILAIRNLCEENEPNRLYMKQLKAEAIASDSEELRRSGFTTELVNGKLVLKPIGRSKKKSEKK